MHYIAESTHGSRNDGDLLNRLRILLKGAYKSMANLVVRHDAALFLIHDSVFLLFPHKHDFDRFKQVFLGNGLPAALNRQNRRLIDHVGKVRTNRA